MVKVKRVVGIIKRHKDYFEFVFMMLIAVIIGLLVGTVLSP